MARIRIRVGYINLTPIKEEIDKFILRIKKIRIVRHKVKKRIKKLKNILYYKEFPLKRAAAGALAELKEVDLLLGAIKSEYKSIRHAAVEAIGKTKSRKAVEPLINALQDKDYYVKKAAICSLGDIGDNAAFEPVMEFLEKDEYKPCTLAAISKMSDKRAIEPLLDAADYYKRHEIAIDGLSRLNAVDEIISLLKKREILSMNDSYECIKALGELGDTRAIEPLLDSFNGRRRKNARLAAAKALAQLGEKQWLEVIKGDDEDYRRMGQTKDKRLEKVLIDSYNSEVYSFSKKACFDALKEIGSLKIVEYLLKELKNKNSISDSKVIVDQIIEICKSNPNAKVYFKDVKDAFKNIHEDRTWHSDEYRTVCAMGFGHKDNVRFSEDVHEDESISIEADF